MDVHTSPTLRAFFLLSYPTEQVSPQGETLYIKGPRDLALVATALVAFTILREVCMRLVLAPLFVYLSGVKARTEKLGSREMRVLQRAAVRFSEQGWLVLYYSAYWSLGMYIFLNSSMYRPNNIIPINFDSIWTSYPKLGLSATHKAYYLTQAAFWFQQIITINLEQRRKDHVQMFTHHIITNSLLIGSYLTNMSDMGTVVLVLMDFADILLSGAKMLKYLNVPTIITDTTFGLFLVSWLVTRQIGLLLVIINIWESGPRMIDVDHPEKYAIGPYDFHFTRPVWLAFFLFLSTLWILICIWFAMICRVAAKVIMGGVADETRSDDEDGGEDETAEEDYDDDGVETDKDSSVSVSSTPNDQLRKRR